MDAAQGGPSMSVSHLAAAQARMGHAVTIWSYSLNRNHNDLARSINDIPDFDKVNLSLMPHVGLGEKLGARRFERYFKANMNVVDIVHIHGIWRPILFSAAKIARENQVQYIIAPRGMLDPWSLSQKSLKKKLALRFIWRKVLNRASYLHALNPAEAELIRPLKLRCPVTIIPNGVSPEEMAALPRPTSCFDSYPQLANRPYIIFLSRLHYKKGLDYLAGAFGKFCRQNSEVDLVVIGPDEGARSAFERRISRLGISNRVHIIGPLYGRQKYAALAGALCFCLPSRQEGFSLAVIEAMGCGLPVVVSSNCHFPEIEQFGCGEVVELDTNAIADALTRIIGDEQHRKQAGQAARELVLSRYTWPKIAARTLVIYNEAIAR
jgi:glycosyltransferase involved in cell wall biosynthesis